MDAPASLTGSVPANAGVVVLGAGPTGLSAAWELARHGVAVLVLEKEEAPGGLCRTHRRDGFSFDMGGHRFITRDHELFDRVVSLLGSALHVAERHSVIRIGSREYTYPLVLSEVLRGEGPINVLRTLGSYAWSRLRGAAGAGREGGFDAWVKRHFGGEIYARFFAGYTEKLWGVSGAELSSDWAGQRIPRLSLRRAIVAALGLSRRPQRTFARKYCYPRSGIGEIFETIATEVTRLGGRIIFGAHVSGVVPGPTPIVTVAAGGQSVEVRCEHVISTLPAPDLVEAMPSPPEVREAARRLTFRSLRFLNLLVDGPDPCDRTWMYVPEASYFMTRVQVPSRRSTENCPAGRSSLQLEIPCQAGDAMWTAPHDELRERGLRDLARLGLDVRSRLLGSFDVRAAHAYPVYRRGYRECRDATLGWLDSLEGVASRGRQGRFDYIFFDRAMREGIDAARAWLGMPPAAATGDDPLLPEESRSLVDGLPHGPLVAARQPA